MCLDGEIVGNGGLGVLEPVSGVLGQDVLALLLWKGCQDGSVQWQHHAQIEMRPQGAGDLCADGERVIAARSGQVCNGDPFGTSRGGIVHG
ncbi:Uncharacterised protein [Mycobacteroides abscessus subsp. massiliense]|nr:Uncharacterised protein [Mycobacteroides abscessus subsp. massiliense]